MTESNVAIFGDLHGRILLALWLAREWQRRHGQAIDHILCVGDLGIYPSRQTMDKASLRYAEKYPEGLGFGRFFLNRENDPNGGPGRVRPDHAVDSVLEELNCGLYFVPGIHEDHEFLHARASAPGLGQGRPVPVDHDWRGEELGLYGPGDFTGYRRLKLLPQGPVVGLSPPPGGKGEAKPKINIRAANGLAELTGPKAWESPRPGSTDILLTYCPASWLAGPNKSQHGEMDAFVHKLSPAWHFSGFLHRHMRRQIQASSDGRLVNCAVLNQVFFPKRDAAISPDCFAILRASGRDARNWELQMVRDSWFCNLRWPQVAMFL